MDGEGELEKMEQEMCNHSNYNDDYYYVESRIFTIKQFSSTTFNFKHHII